MRAPGPKGQVLFIQGAGAGAHDDWDDKMVDSLRRALGDRFEVRYPRMPNEDDPTVATWSLAIRRELAEIDDGSVVVGHSVGGAIALHVLAQSPQVRRLAAVVLISAPFLGDGGWPPDRFELPVDLGATLPKDLVVHVIHGLEDDTVPPSHADLYGRAIPQAHLHLLPGRDHQIGNDLGVVGELIGGPHRHDRRGQGSPGAPTLS